MIWPYALLLVAWGNVAATLLGATAVLPGGSWPFVISGGALVALSLVSATRAGLRPSDLGLGMRGSLRGAVLAGLVAAAVALIGIAALRLAAPLVGQTVEYEPLRRVSGSELALHIAFFLPLGAVLPEELAFRGALFGSLRPRGLRTAILASSIAFALWHGSVAFATIAQTSLGATPWAIAAAAGVLLVAFGGGVIFATLRAATGTLAASIVAHWAFNAAVLVGLWATLSSRAVP